MTIQQLNCPLRTRADLLVLKPVKGLQTLNGKAAADVLP